MSKTTPRLRTLLSEQQTALDTMQGNNGVAGRKAFLAKGSPHRVAPLDERKRNQVVGHLPVISPLNLNDNKVQSGLGPNSATRSGPNSGQSAGVGLLPTVPRVGGSARSTTHNDPPDHKKSVTPHSEPELPQVHDSSLAKLPSIMNSGRKRSHQDTNGAIKPTSKTNRTHRISPISPTESESSNNNNKKNKRHRTTSSVTLTPQAEDDVDNSSNSSIRSHRSSLGSSMSGMGGAGVGQRITNMTNAPGATALRGDISAFLERFVKESLRQSHLNLPHLLANFLPSIGISDLSSIESQSSAGGSFYFGPEDSSNIFLSNKTAMGPFVSHMTFYSVNDPDTGEASDYQPIEMEGALLFLDISGYSRISSALQDKGAHAIGAVVNAYMGALLEVCVGEFHGDVLKFAGDAVMVTWSYDADIERSCLMAAMCALALQERCGEFHIETDDDQEELSFRIHIGLAAGRIESEVFQPRSALSMQKAYHFVHGDLFSSIGPVVDSAKSGEVAMSRKFKEYLEDHIKCHPYAAAGATQNEDTTVYQLDAMASTCQEQLNFLDDDDDGPVLPDRPRGAEAQFIHPSIVKKLHFGVPPTHMAEMRLLTVLFIHKSNPETSIADWFYESQEILDTNRCPIVQIIQDDKGIHLVAAVGLFVAEPDPTMVGLRAARALKDREVECTTGMATGMVFCGIIGSSRACRWDITGGACVRAARLMQYAVAHNLAVAVDESLRERVVDVSQLTQVTSGVSIKGSPKPVTIFTLSAKSNEVTSRIVTTANYTKIIHSHAYEELAPVLTRVNGKLRRAVGIVSGPVGSGKKAVCTQLADGFARLLHQTTRGAAALSIATTLASWFYYHKDQELAKQARAIQRSWEQNLISKTMHLTLGLVALTITKGLSTCFIVHHANFLDSYSLSLLNQIHNKTTEGTGRWITMLTHFPLFESISVAKLKATVGDSKTSLRSTQGTPRGNSSGNFCNEVPVVYLKEISKEEFALNMCVKFPWRIPQNGIDLMLELGGGIMDFCTNSTSALTKEYFQRREMLDATTGVELETELSRVDKLGRAHFFAEGLDVVRTMPWTQSNPEMLSRLTGLYDVLPPRLQTILKVIAAMCKQSNSFHPLVTDVGWMSIKLVSKRNTKEVTHAIGILVDQHILKTDAKVRRVWFQLPAMKDMMLNLCTPDQITAINQECAKRYEANLAHVDQKNQPAHAWALFTAARFFLAAYGPSDKSYRMHMQAAWEIIKALPGDSGPLVAYGFPSTCHMGRSLLQDGIAKLPNVNPTKSSLEHELLLDSKLFHFDPMELFGATPSRSDPEFDPHDPSNGKIPDVVVDVKNYTAPIALGPLCDTLVKIAALVRDCYVDAMSLDKTLRTNDMNEAIGSYITMCKRWEKAVPVAHIKDRVYSDACAEGEEATLRSLVDVGSSTTEQQAEANCKAFMDYTRTVVNARATRVTRYAAWMQVLPTRAEKKNPTLSRAFHRLKVDNLGNITQDSFHGALMALATEDWTPTNPQINLEWIRDSCLKKNTTTLAEFKAFLYLYCIL